MIQTVLPILVSLGERKSKHVYKCQMWSLEGQWCRQPEPALKKLSKGLDSILLLTRSLAKNWCWCAWKALPFPNVLSLHIRTFKGTRHSCPLSMETSRATIEPLGRWSSHHIILPSHASLRTGVTCHPHTFYNFFLYLGDSLGTLIWSTDSMSQGYHHRCPHGHQCGSLPRQGCISKYYSSGILSFPAPSLLSLVPWWLLPFFQSTRKVELGYIKNDQRKF